MKYKFKTWLTSSHTYNVKSEGRRPTDWVKVAFLFFLVQISHFCFALSVLLLTMKWLLTFPFALLSRIHSLEINMAREVWQWTTKDWTLPFFKDILLTLRWSFMYYFHTAELYRTIFFLISPVCQLPDSREICFSICDWGNPYFHVSEDFCNLTSFYVQGAFGTALFFYVLTYFIL